MIYILSYTAEKAFKEFVDNWQTKLAKINRTKLHKSLQFQWQNGNADIRLDLYEITDNNPEFQGKYMYITRDDIEVF